jgi:cytidyltransferase-like protein
LNRPPVLVSGGFDTLSSAHVRFLEAAAGLGEVQVCLWTDECIQAVTGRPPAFPLNERRYLLEALRFVSGVTVHAGGPDLLPEELPVRGGSWAMRPADLTPAREAFARASGLRLEIVPEAALQGFPVPDVQPADGRDRVVVTGCYDWLHSGHVRFFEEASQFGDLYVGVGSDRTVRELKGAPHPMFPEAERRYLVQSVRFVKQAFINSGSGYLDAAPDIEALKPQFYVVNEDGDRPEKREFCAEHGIRYVVLKRLPKEGLPGRDSTTLRGF